MNLILVLLWCICLANLTNAAMGRNSLTRPKARHSTKSTKKSKKDQKACIQRTMKRMSQQRERTKQCRANKVRLEAQIR